jgi:hypothetical protein
MDFVKMHRYVRLRCWSEDSLGAFEREPDRVAFATIQGSLQKVITPGQRKELDRKAYSWI